MLIGEVAARAGVKVETLRYYERRGLLAEPERAASGYRLYDEEAVHVVRFVRRAQELGFSLREIEQLLLLRDEHVAPREEVLTLAEAKLATVEGKIRQLSALRASLRELVLSCRRGNEKTDCPILDAMDEDLKIP